MDYQKFSGKLARQPVEGRASILHRFRLLFYTGGFISVLLVTVLGILSYSQYQSGSMRLSMLAATALILAIVAFLVYIVLTELNSRARAYQREHELNRLKSNFVTLASHEFRTPLSSILLSAALIEKYAAQQDEEKIAKHSLKIKQVVHHLESVLEDFLALEKLEAGELSANIFPFDLTQLCREILVDTGLVIKTGQQLSYDATGISKVVSLDQLLIRKAITHLLLNAINYAGENARIRLITDIQSDRVSISVKDNGVGIAEKDQKKLATLFYRVSESGNIPGTGLGLAIVKRYVELMNGRFDFYSRPADETCFKMEFTA